MKNTCVCCGDEIPEGRMVCPVCMTKAGRRTCGNCKYHDPFSWACGYGDSPFAGGATDPKTSCKYWTSL